MVNTCSGVDDSQRRGCDIASLKALMSIEYDFQPIMEELPKVGCVLDSRPC